MDMLACLRAYFQTIDPNHYVDVLPAAAAGSQPDDLYSAAHLSPELISTLFLACTSESFRPAPPIAGLDYVVLTQRSSLADVQEGLNTNAWGFDPSAVPASEEEAEAFRQGLVTNCAFTARYNGQPAAAGMFTPPAHGVAEIAGITTLVAYRRRGIAAALTSEIVRVALTYGVEIAVLSTDNPEAFRIYTRIGFTPAGLLLKRPDVRNDH